MLDKYSYSSAPDSGTLLPELADDLRHQRERRKTAILKNAILRSSGFSAGFSIIATDENGLIQIFNAGAERMLGYPMTEVVNQINSSQFFDPRDTNARAQLLSLELATPVAPGFEALICKAARGLEDNCELNFVRKDGSQFPAIVSITALHDESDEIIGYLLISTDNSARKQAEAELTSARIAADRANLAKSQFLSNMSHELRSPLNAILGFAQLLESDTAAQTDSQKESTTQILQAGWYLLDLINEILDLALIESGKLSMSLEPISLEEILHDCQAMIEPEAQKHGVALSFCRFTKPIYIHADRTRVKQVLINLLSNAIKYNHSGGAVIIDCAVKPGDRLHLRVKDTGPGLSPEKQAQLFQPFNRLGAENGGEEGTGIGLVMTKRLVELMGGAIGVESTVGKGSVFWVDLIRGAEPSVADGGEALDFWPLQIHGDLIPHTVLCVEDNPANLKLIKHLVGRRPNLRLLSAGDAALGIALARDHQPDVILMDINLPGMNGVEALTVLRDDALTRHIPVVALTANAMPYDIRKGLEAGFFRYLTKPIRVDAFMEALDVAMKLGRTHRIEPAGSQQAGATS